MAKEEVKTNEIKEVVDEQEIVEGYEQPDVDKTADGYSHLTEEDLNPDYEPPQEAKEEEPEADAQSEESPEVAKEGETEESEAKEESEEVSSKKWDINGTTYSEDDVTTRMTKDYENLTSFSGKQAEQIGGYKQKITELESELAAEKTHANEDANSDPANKKEYDIYTQKGLLEMVEDRAKAIVKESEAANLEKSKNDKFLSEAESARSNFSKNHPEYSDEKSVVDLIQFGVSKGLALGDNAGSEAIGHYLETVHANKTGDYSFFTKESSGTDSKKTVQKETIKRVKESNKVKKGLSNVNSSNSNNIDYDALTDDEWAKLPDEKRMELLGL